MTFPPTLSSKCTVSGLEIHLEATIYILKARYGGPMAAKFKTHHMGAPDSTMKVISIITLNFNVPGTQKWIFSKNLVVAQPHTDSTNQGAHFPFFTLAHPFTAAVGEEEADIYSSQCKASEQATDSIKDLKFSCKTCASNECKVLFSYALGELRRLLALLQG